MEQSVETLCNLLVKSKLFQPKDVKGIYQRWRTEGKQAVKDPAAFAKWLVTGKYVTEFQANLLLRGKVDNFFFNQYKMLDRIGKGRMAGIYKASHALGQTVAIKVLPPSKAKDANTFARFQREARLAIKLKHPNVVRTFQLGNANGLHYIVMEYLDGETLEEVLQRRKQLPPAEAVRVVYQALSGLQEIHDEDMVHRDMKPANLMLVPGAVRGQPDNTLRSTVKLLDIGLGRALFDDSAPGPGGAEEIQLTTAGEMLGTPEYLAPEQARDAHAADIRADIYSLGCVLYHCLTGQTPFPDQNQVRMMVRHATEPPKPPREINPAIPEGLQQVVLQMLAKDPAQRYAKPDRVSQALQPFLAAAPEAGKAAEDPQLKKYIDWVESSSDMPAVPAMGGPASAAPPASVATAPPPTAVTARTIPGFSAPSAVPLGATVPLGPPVASLAPATQRLVPQRLAPPPAATPPPPPPAPVLPPAGIPPLLQATELSQPVDVVLASPQDQGLKRSWIPDLNQLSPKQYLLLGFGIGIIGVIIAAVIALVLSVFLV